MIHNLRRIPTRALQRAAARAIDQTGIDQSHHGRIYRALVRAMAHDRDSLARAISRGYAQATQIARQECAQ